MICKKVVSCIPRPHPPRGKGLETIERFLSFANSAVSVFGKPIKSLNIHVWDLSKHMHTVYSGVNANNNKAAGSAQPSNVTRPLQGGV